MSGPIGEFLAELPLVDHHCHGVYADELPPSEFERHATESEWRSPPGTSVFDGPFGVAVRGICAPLLGVPAHCTAAEYLARRSELGQRATSELLLAASGIETFLIDTGHQSTTVLNVTQMAALSGHDTAEVVRLEPLAEAVARDGTAAGFAGRFADALAVAAAGAVGVKSIAAYRYGLDLDPSRPTPAQVRGATDRWLRAAPDGVRLRLTDPILLRHLLWTAVDLGKPIQLHVGYGDPDIVLHRCDPSHLTGFLHATRETGTQIMLLHCYPFLRQAGILAQLFPHVWLDASSAITFAGPGSGPLIRESLEIAPFHKVLFASDAFGLPEFYLCGARFWRQGVGRVLDEWLAEGAIGRSDAERYAQMMARDNAIRGYRLGGGG